MTDNRNTILAVILSGLVLLGWQYFFNIPQMEKQRAQSRPRAEMAKPTPQATTAPPRRPARRRHLGQRAGNDATRFDGARGRPRHRDRRGARASRSTPRALPAAFR